MAHAWNRSARREWRQGGGWAAFTVSSGHLSFSQNAFPGWLMSSRRTRGPMKELFWWREKNVSDMLATNAIVFGLYLQNGCVVAPAAARRSKSP